MSYNANVKIGDYTLVINPEKISHNWLVMGSSDRTIGGKAIRQFVSDDKLSVSISGVTQAEYDEIKKYIAARYNIEYIDYIPITERGSQSREVVEDISTDTVNGETVYTYVPKYYMDITANPVSYEANVASWELTLEEI